MSNQPAKAESGPHSSTSSQNGLSAPPTPMWFGTKSRICFNPALFNAADMRAKPCAPPSSGLKTLWSVMS